MADIFWEAERREGNEPSVTQRLTLGMEVSATPGDCVTIRMAHEAMPAVDPKEYPPGTEITLRCVALNQEGQLSLDVAYEMFDPLPEPILNSTVNSTSLVVFGDALAATCTVCVPDPDFLPSLGYEVTHDHFGFPPVDSKYVTFVDEVTSYTCVQAIIDNTTAVPAEVLANLTSD